MNFEDVEKARRIRVFRNGDSHFPPVTVTLGKRQIANMQSLLDIVTKQVQATEAVRKLCTPETGTIVKRLDHLADDCAYVAVGNRKFKNIKYGRVTAEQRNRYHSNGYRKPPSSFNDSARFMYSSANYSNSDTPRCHLDPLNVISIRVFANGNAHDKPKRVILTKQMLQSWSNVLEEVTNKVNPTSGVVTRLYKLDGKPVKKPDDLEAGESYVAIGTERGGFQALDYGHVKPLYNLSTRIEHRYLLSPIPVVNTSRTKLWMYEGEGGEEDDA